MLSTICHRHLLYLSWHAFQIENWRKIAIHTDWSEVVSVRSTAHGVITMANALLCPAAITTRCVTHGVYGIPHAASLRRATNDGSSTASFQEMDWRRPTKPLRRKIPAAQEFFDNIRAPPHCLLVARGHHGAKISDGKTLIIIIIYLSCVVVLTVSLFLWKMVAIFELTCSNVVTIPCFVDSNTMPQAFTEAINTPAGRWINYIQTQVVNLNQAIIMNTVLTNDFVHVIFVSGMSCVPCKHHFIVQL